MGMFSQLPGMVGNIGADAAQAAKSDPDPYGGGIPFIPAPVAEDLADPWMAGSGPTFGSASASAGAGDLFDGLF
jgi:hypothetical protein